MTESRADHGYFRCGIPYNRIGAGPRVAVVFQGLLFENKPATGLGKSTFVLYRFLEQDYTAYLVLPKRGLPQGHSMADLAADYAGMIQEEFGGPVDVIGTSTGGSIALQLGADHPDVVRRLVIHSSAYKLGKPGKEAQLRALQFARQGRRRQMCAEMLVYMFKPGPLRAPAVWAMSALMALGTRSDLSDFCIVAEAEDRFDFHDRLADIRVPTLVVAGLDDPGYTPALFRETAEGIPGATLILYEKMGHPAGGKQFAQDVLEFLHQ